MNTPLKITFPGNVITDAHNETVATLNPGHREFAEFRELFKFSPELKTALEGIATLSGSDAPPETDDSVLFERIHRMAMRALAITVPNAPGPWKAAPETYAKLSNS